MFEKKKEGYEEIVVLGKTFKSEEERRTYFREELRKHLSELKKMEGFPIGEDEDIIKLSDPPYYTACPNPWLNNFIEEWEEEKKQLEKEGKREQYFEVDEPYAADVSEGKNNPIYNAHSYHTKVPHPAIMRYVFHYTQPGDIIYDGFAGTGMTGVAASMCSKPEQEFQHKMDNPESDLLWGQRRSICTDLSSSASFIAGNYNIKHNLLELKSLVDQIIIDVKEKFGWMYETYHQDGSKGIINYSVWSEVFSCSNCTAEIVFLDNYVSIDTKEVNDFCQCEKCGIQLTKNKLNRLFETTSDIDGNIIKIIKRVPSLIYYKVGKKRYIKQPDSLDIKTIEKINSIKYDNWIPNDEIIEGDKTRELLRLGVSKVSHLYTKRNLIVLSEIRAKIRKNTLLLIHNSINTTLASLLVRFNLGKRGNGILTGTFYLPSMSAETNVFNLFEGKSNDFLKALRYVDDSLVQTSSSTDAGNIKSDSIDYIFTDPPFGANIMYSELNFIQESWLRVRTNQDSEAIQNKTQNKSFHEYTFLLSRAMKENYRILKPGKWMTVEFSNTNASIWNSIQTSIQKAGFVIANVSGLDKKQGSFNSVSNATSVKQDLVISCYKPSSEFDQKFKQNQHTDIAIWDFVEEHLQHLPIHLTTGNSTTAIIERSPKILFDRLIAFYVQKGLPVPIDAGKFQQGLRERFIERDGMFFTNEQVQEYDKKKKKNPEFIQLSILVSSEQDGVLWLKNVLTEKSLTYQDIQPEWMQALAGVRKGDVIPELATILEENFLKDDAGKWYTPDPENEADLEKLRAKRLLRHFDGYKQEALKPKSKKIKVVRVEALRAGFKQCYQDKDFKSIVTIGDKIPNNLLMEDEVLLQFYDIASSRV